MPPGRHPLPREFITQHQRARIIAALAEETVEKGYRAVTVADIVRRAGIARNTFYENFSSKEDCFLAASEFAVKEALRRVVDAASRVDSWPARVNSGLAAFLHYVSTEPALARTCIVEALSAGPAAVERYERSIQAFVPLFRMGREWQVTPTSAGFRYESDLLGLDLPAPALVGAHQIDNAATAVACIERLRAAQFRIDDAAIARGLASVEWPARLQKLSRGPLVEAVPPGGELWLDGGHNEDCGIALARQAAEWAKEPAPLPLYLIFGMLTTKDAAGFLRPLARYARAARAVPIEGHAAYTPQESCARATEVGLDCVPTTYIGAALEDLLATQPAPMRILICGSLYVAGEVLARNG